MAQAVHLPLVSVQRLVVEHLMQFRFPPSPAVSGATMREACKRLASVPHLQLSDMLYLYNTKPKGGPVVVPPDQCGPHLESALAGLQPLAGRLPTLHLSLEWLGSRQQDTLQGRAPQLGPELLRGLHAGLGGTLTKLDIRPYYHTFWAPGKGFWAALQDVLPQLQALELERVAPLGGMSAVALAAACTKLQRAGRHLELVFKQPLNSDEMREMAEQLGVYQPHVRVVVVP